MRRTWWMFCILAVGLVVLSGRPVTATSGSMYLSAPAPQVSFGQTVDVQVRASSELAIAAVQANFTYDTSRLEAVGTDFSGSAYEFGVEASATGGLVKIARATFNPKNGDQLVGSITFKALTEGVVNLQFTTDTQMSDGTTTITTQSGLQLTIGAAAVAVPQPTPTLIKKPIATPQAEAVQLAASVNDQQPPVISQLAAVDVTYNTAALAWITDEPAQGYIEVGLDTTYGTRLEVPVSSAHRVAVNGLNLTPMTTYYYALHLQDTSGNATDTFAGEFTTSGVLAYLAVVDAAGQPIANATVMLNGITKTTDSTGHVSFEAPLGKADIRTVHHGRQQTQSIQVAYPAADGAVPTHVITISTDTMRSITHRVASLLACGLLATAAVFTTRRIW